MTHHRLTNRDYEGYGVYEYDGIQGLGQLPDLGTLRDYEIVRGLAHVPAGSQPFAKGMLEQMIFQKTNLPELGGVTGTASYVLGSSGGSWVSDLVAQGYVVMVERASVPSGTIRVVASEVPATIVLLAGQAAPAYVIVDADPTALGAAEAYAGQGPSPPPPGIPPGLPPGIPGMPPQGATHAAPCEAHETERSGWCYPIPGGVEPGHEPGPEPGPLPPPPSKLGSWVLPVAIGTAAVALIAVVVSRNKGDKPKSLGTHTVRSATANRQAWR